MSDKVGVGMIVEDWQKMCSAIYHGNRYAHPGEIGTVAAILLLTLQLQENGSNAEDGLDYIANMCTTKPDK